MNNIISTLQQDNNYIVISSNSMKEKLLEKLSNRLVKASYKTYSEFVSECLGELTDEVILDNFTKDEIVEITKLKLDNARLVNKLSETKYLNELFILNNKNFIKEENNLIINNYYNKRKVYLINYNKDDDAVNEALKRLNTKVVYLNTETNNTKDLEIYKFKNIEKEVFYTVNEIAKLLKSGVKPENIVINSPSSEYEVIFQEAFNLYEIDYCEVNSPSLINYEYTKKILVEIEKSEKDFKEAFKEIVDEKLAGDHEDLELLSQIVNTLNILMKYDKFSKKEYLELAKFLLANHTFSKQKLTNVIKFENVFENVYSTSDYIFINNFNQDVTPHTYKNDSYIKDEERVMLDLLTSTKKNKLAKEKISKFLLNNNVFASYSISNKDGLAVKSSLIDEMKKEHNVKEIEMEFDIEEVTSSKYALLRYTKSLELYKKYGDKNNDILKGYNSLNESLTKKYDNNFSGCLNEIISKHFEETEFSYSSLQDYYNCPFRYYLSYVLKEKKPTNVENRFIGNWFHHVLEKLLKEESDLDDAVRIEIYTNEYITSKGYTLTPKLNYFTKKLNSRILSAYNIIKTYELNSDFIVYSLEKKFDFEINGYKFTGKIDKILKFENYYIVIDYKTNEGKVDWLNIDKGLEIQLPIYAYLIRKEDPNAKIAGCYLQSVLDKSLLEYSTKDIDQLFYANRRYKGYTLQDKEVIDHIDHNSEDESLRSINTKVYKAGKEFSSDFLKKSFIEKDFNKIIKMAEDLILEAIRKIENKEFNISPISLGDSLVGCKYCGYKDICYKKIDNVKEVIKNKDFSFLLGGEEDGRD